MAQTIQPPQGPDAINFVRHCAGRYELELPDDMRMVLAGYGQAEFGFTIYHPSSSKIGILTGESRINQWVDHVEKKRLANHHRCPTRYVLKELEPDIKTIIYYEDRRAFSKDPNYSHIFNVFYFKDFPEKETGIIIHANAWEFIPRESEDVDAILKPRLRWMKKAIENVQYRPWPHNQVGVCMPGNIHIANLHPPMVAEGEKHNLLARPGEYKESYSVQFYNDKDSRIKLTAAPRSKESIKKTLDRATGFIAFFASRKMKVAGRKGRLFISDGKYSSTQRQFRWISTDTKPNSVQYAQIKIEGSIEIEDYPDMAPLNATDMIVGLLKGIKIRENGMTGVKH